MQKFFQTHFKERSLYYSTFAIQEQAVKGKWDFSLCPVYCISLLDFVLKDEAIDPNSYLHKIKLIDTQTGRTFNDKLNFVFIEIPRFNKKLDELETERDKWMYLLTNLEFLERLPEELQSKIFRKVMGIAELVKLQKTDRQAYEDSLKKHRDLKNVLDTQERLGFERGMERGMEKGREKGIEEGIAKGMEMGVEKAVINFFKSGVDIEIISVATGFSKEEILKLL